MDIRYNTNSNDMFHPQKKQEAAPTTSLLAAMYGRPAPLQHDLKISPKCVSQPLRVPQQDAFAPRTPEDVGGLYEEATWRMYHRIQTARQAMPLHPAGCHPMLPSEDQLNRHLPVHRLQPRKTGTFTKTTAATDSEWDFHVEPQAVETDADSDYSDDDPIFDMEL